MCFHICRSSLGEGRGRRACRNQGAWKRAMYCAILSIPSRITGVTMPGGRTSPSIAILSMYNALARNLAWCNAPGARMTNQGTCQPYACPTTWNTEVYTFLTARAVEVRSWAQQYLLEGLFGRDDYRELCELVIKYLGGQVSVPVMHWIGILLLFRCDLIIHGGPICVSGCKTSIWSTRPLVCHACTWCIASCQISG